jgi:hypothetical protein
MTKATTDDSNRPVLECLCIEDGEVLAADGYMLVRKAIYTEGIGSMMIPGKVVRKASSALISKNMLVTTENNIDITFQHLEDDPLVSARKDESTFKTKGITGSFPKSEDLYPVSEPKAMIALDPALLKRLCEVVEDTGLIVFRIRGIKEPVEFLAGSDISGLLMPMYPRDTLLESKRWHPTKKEIMEGLKGQTREWLKKEIEES